MTKKEEVLALLDKPTLKRTNIQKILGGGYPQAVKIFDEIQKKSKRTLPRNRILTADFLEMTGIKKEDFR